MNKCANLGERLKKTREFLQLSQKEMGKKASVSLQMWQAYEAGKSVPGGKVLEALSLIGFNVNWLLTGEGEMHLRSEVASSGYVESDRPIIWEYRYRYLLSKIRQLEEKWQMEHATLSAMVEDEPLNNAKMLACREIDVRFLLLRETSGVVNRAIEQADDRCRRLIESVKR